jgi:hypothetical protein
MAAGVSIITVTVSSIAGMVDPGEWWLMKYQIIAMSTSINNKVSSQRETWDEKDIKYHFG